MNRSSFLCLRAAVVLFASLGLASWSYAQGKKVDFHKTIKPLFDKYCLECHCEEKTEGFRIDLKEESMDYITAGDAEDSQMYQVLVTDDENELMPPPDEDNPMSADEIKLVKTWINQGAEWPEDEQETQDSEDKSAAPQTSSAEAEIDEPQTSESNRSSDSTDNKKSTETKAAKADDAQSAKAAPAAAAAPAVGKTDPRIYRAIGSLHPAAVHLPIGLLLAAGLFAFLSLRGNFVMSDCAYYCLWLGALGCIAASVSGWWNAPMKFRTEEIKEVADLLNQDHRVFWHRTGGLIVTAVSLVLAMFAASARNRDPDDGMLWKLGLILLAVGVGWVGHEGGKLTYGKYHYKDLNELASEWFPGVFGKKDAPQDAGDQEKEDKKSSDEKSDTKENDSRKDEIET